MEQDRQAVLQGTGGRPGNKSTTHPTLTPTQDGRGAGISLFEPEPAKNSKQMWGGHNVYQAQVDGNKKRNKVYDPFANPNKQGGGGGWFGGGRPKV